MQLLQPSRHNTHIQKTACHALPLDTATPLRLIIAGTKIDMTTNTCIRPPTRRPTRTQRVLRPCQRTPGMQTPTTTTTTPPPPHT
mmetsp:Transcript_44121/g.124877  ORF Transcript_44121/g.124877 Transcript_44121/m.124877 type:complete len:85 (+) Transcript_44121:195-449(+)